MKKLDKNNKMGLIGLIVFCVLCTKLCSAEVNPCDVYRHYKVYLNLEKEKESQARSFFSGMELDLARNAKTAQDFRIIDQLKILTRQVSEVIVDKQLRVLGQNTLGNITAMEGGVISSLFEKLPKKTDVEQSNLEQLKTNLKNTQEYKIVEAKLQREVSWIEIKYDVYALFATEQYKMYYEYSVSVNQIDKLQSNFLVYLGNQCLKSQQKKP